VWFESHLRHIEKSPANVGVSSIVQPPTRARLPNSALTVIGSSLSMCK
jgi:hypothetical protein